MYFNCSWKLLSAPSTLDAWLTINSWRTSRRVKYPIRFYLRNTHSKRVLDVLIVKHFKTLVFFWILPFPHDFKNTSLEDIDVPVLKKRNVRWKFTLCFGFVCFVNLFQGFWLVGFCYPIIVVMMKPVYLFEQNLLSLNARYRKVYRTCNISHSITSRYLRF